VFSACAKGTGEKTMPAQTMYSLGTVCTVSLYEDGTKEVYDELYARLSEITARFSVSVATSDIARINQSAGVQPVQVHDEVIALIQKAVYFAEKSGGAFDPTIGPLSVLWAIGTDDARVPTREEIDALLPLVDYRKIVIDEAAHTVFLPQPGMILDLGAIAKGYAADELVRIARSHAVTRAVIDLGGNVYVYGVKADGTKWRVGIKNPENPGGDPVVRLEVSENSIVTSGMYERYFEQDGVRYHHILNPKTGYPAYNGVLSSTIVSQSSLAADALSTAVFVLGKDKGLALLESGFAEIGVSADGIVIADDHTVTATAGLAADVTVLLADYK
jgi:thiamine biosynthesis lipoprotein